MGEWREEKRNGVGSRTYFNGDKYTGGWKDGKRHGDGKYSAAVGTYEGMWKDDRIQGKGTFTFTNGEKYTGSWSEGKSLHSEGIVYVNGDRYFGEKRNGKPHGQGLFLYSSGVKLIGLFEDGELVGPGIKYSIDGSRISSGLFAGENRIVRERYVDLDTFDKLTHLAQFPVEINNFQSKNSQNIGATPRVAEWTVTENGCKVWNPYPENGETVRWNGKCSNNYVDGHGEVTWSVDGKDKSKDRGDFKAGHLQGLGSTTTDGDVYVGNFKDSLRNGEGTHTLSNGDKFIGEFRDSNYHGRGIYTYANGDKYVGEFKDGKYHGQAIFLFANGIRREGIWENGFFVREAKVSLPKLNENAATNNAGSGIDSENHKLAEEQRYLEKKQPREKAGSSQRINLQVSATLPTSDGEYFISIETNVDTASLKVNGEELGGKVDGRYKINRVARAGQDTKLDIIAKDVYGNLDRKTITVSRAITESRVVYASLNPAQVKRQPDRDAVAIIIGISNYKTLPKAEFANDDARVFYDYAIRALGVKPENIKLLVDQDAEEVEVIKAFKTWLPSRVKLTTDVYVFYSGHGLPTHDGQGLYLLPLRADRDFISRTSIQFQEISADIQATKPKSVTIFMDACYSGQARSGEALVANARPVTLRADKKLFPDSFTVITASQADQISSSSPDLKHGIFSYYLMKGMEGDADANKDGKITLGEMQAYLVENVGRQAGMMSRKQEPQLVGDAGRVLVGR